jgi:hypothetical protein
MEKPTHERRKTLVNLVRIVVVAVFCAAIPRMSNAQNANRMYSEKCASCHAADGSAHTAAATKMAVPDLRTKRVRQMSDDDLYAATAEGKPFAANPGLGWRKFTIPLVDRHCALRLTERLARVEFYDS